MRIRHTCSNKTFAFRSFISNFVAETRKEQRIMKNHETPRLEEDNEYKREELIRKIENAIKHLTIKELEALSYEMFTRGYIDEY